MKDIIPKGSKGGSSQKTYQPTEMEDNLISINKIKVLLAVSDGEVTPDFSLQNLYLDDVPVVSSNGTVNYEGVTAEFRSGTQVQEYIQGMDGASNEITLAREITTTTPYVLSVTNTQLSAVRVKLYMPRGVTITDKSDQIGVVVDYAIDMAIDGGSYSEVIKGQFNGKTTSGYDRSIRVNLPSVTWSSVLIRVRRVTADSTSSSVTDAIQITSYAEVIDAKFRYPLTGLVYVEMNSDLFPTQIPTISIKKKWKLINVPVNYDPVTRTYSGTWNGTFKKAWSNNPAWVLYDLMTNVRYGLDQKDLGVEVDKWSLYEAAQYCDQMVPDGKGGQEPRYLCDVVIQSKVEAYQLIRDIASIFRGMTYYNGESISVVIDKPRDASYLFTNDNVVNGEFTYTFASDKTMYTSCDVTFDDEQNSYSQDVEPVFDAEATLRYGYNSTEITAIGCVRRSEANRRGRWILKTNLKSETVNFATGLEGMIPTIGDVISVADNFWSSALALNLSGRVMEVSGLQVFLPFRVDARAGDAIVINKPDGAPVRRTIASISDDAKTIVLNVGFGFDVEPDTTFAIDRTDIAFKQYVVTKIERGTDSDDFVHNISATQYDPNKYDEIDFGVNIDDRPTSIVDPDSMVPPENLSVTSYSRVVQGMSVETMVISWDMVQYAKSYLVQWRKDDGNWINIPETANKEVEVDGIYAGMYQVRVRSKSTAGNMSSWSEVVNVSLTGKDGEPSAPINILASTDEVFGIRVKWGFPEGSGDTAYTELQQIPDNGAGGHVDPEQSSLLTMVPYPQYEYWHTTLPAGYVNWYRARLVDRIGNVSEWTEIVRGMASDDVQSIIGEIKVDIENSDGFKYLQQNAIDSNGAIQAQAESIIENALANDGDVRRMTKENGKRKAEYVQAVNLIADETQARVEALTALKAQIDDEVVASITEVQTALATETEARTTADTALSAQIGDTQAALNEKLDSWVDAESAGAQYGVKLGLKYNGVEYSAGMSMELVGSGSGVKSQFIFDANRFAISNGIGSGSGQWALPFVVESNQVFIQSAVIKDGSITNAKIGNVIQSNNYVAGSAGWMINKSGSAELSNATVRGNLYANSGNFAFNGTNNTVQINGNGITVNLANGGRVVVGTF